MGCSPVLLNSLPIGVDLYVKEATKDENPHVWALADCAEVLADLRLGQTRCIEASNC